MGRPLNKRNFGTSTINGEIEVKFFNGTADVVGWIMSQKGTKKFRCTDGTLEAVCWLKWDGTANTAGEMSIGMTDDAGAADFVRKIAGHKATLAGGDVVGWRYSDTSVASDDLGEIDESDGYADGVDVAAPDLVATTVYVITEVGDTDWVTEQAGGTPPASNAVGEVFTAGAAGTGTGIAQEYTA